jgi:hypothetical protein
MQASLLRLKEARALLSNAPAAGTASAPALSFDLRREGEVWAVMSGGKTALLKHTRALEILKQLVEHPGREFHVLDLGPDGEPGSALDTGDAGEVIDLAAKAAYEKRLGALRSEVEEAERWNDAGRRARLQAELEFLEDELGRGVGKGGKLRRSASAAERARVNVYKRLKGVIERLATDLPEAARHLKVCVRTGIFVSYHPGADPGHVR